MSRHTPQQKSGLDLAIEAAGSQAELARAIGVTRGAIQGWVRRGFVPAERVLAVEDTTGIHRSELRPDLYPKERVADSHAA